MLKERTVDEWFQEVNDGLEYRRLYGLEDNWAKLDALASNASGSIASSAGPNIIYSFGDDLLSTLNVPNPALLVDPITMQEMGSAPIVESVDNQLIKQLKMNDEVEIGTYSAFLFGTSFFKIGYDSEFGWSPELDYNGPNQPVGFSLTQINTRQRFIEFNEIEPGMPWFQAVMPHDVVVPWGTRDLDHAPWIAHRIVRHVEDIKDDPKYSARNLQPNMSMTDFMKSYQTSIKSYRIGTDDIMKSLEIDGKAEYCEMWEIHDKRTGKIYVISSGSKRFLRNEKNSLQLYGLPFVELGFTPKTNRIWRTSDAQYLLTAQAELSDISIQSAKQRRINVLKFMYRKGSITKPELEKLLSSDVGIAAGIDGPEDLRNVIVPMQGSQSQGMYQEADFVRSNARETTGFTRTQAGEYAGARTSAYEVQQVQEARDIRMTRRQQKIANVYIESMRKINEIIFRYWRTQRIIKTVGPDGLQQWANYVGSQLKGKFSYNLTFNSAPFATDDSRKQEALQLFQFAMNGLLDPMLVMQELARSYRDVPIRAMLQQGIQQRMQQLQAQAATGQAPGQRPGGNPAGPGASQGANSGGLRLTGS